MKSEMKLIFFAYLSNLLCMFHDKDNFISQVILLNINIPIQLHIIQML